MTEEYLIPSIICDSNTSKKDVESFAVIYDFLKNQEKKYIHLQKNLFWGGISLIIVGVILLVLYPLLLFHFLSMPLIFNLISISILALGVILIAIFFIRKPSLVTLQKIYLPFSLVDLTSQITTNSIVMDPTEKLWNRKFSYIETMDNDIESNVKALPREITSYKVEVNALNLLRNINDNLKYSKEIDTNLPISGFFNKIVPYAEKLEISPTHIVPFEEYEESSNKISSLSGSLDRANAIIDFLEENRKRMEERVKIYTDYLKKLHNDEKDYMLSYMAKFVEEVIKLPNFFTPLINDFREDIRDYQLMIRRIGETKIAEIKNRVKTDLNSIEKSVMDMSVQVETELKGMEKHVGRSQREKIEKMIAGLHGIREAMLRDIIRARKELGKKKETMITEKREENIENMVFWWGAREKIEEKMEIVKNELKIYDILRTQLDKQIKNIEINTKSVFGTLRIPPDKINRILNNFRKRIVGIMEEGRKNIEKSSKMFEEDYSRVMRNVNHLENIKEYFEDMIGSSEKILEEEMKRHLKPFEERISLFEKEKSRIDYMFDEIIRKNREFIEKIKSVSFENSPQGVYLVPYWILGYDRKGSIITAVYSLSEFYGSSLRGKFKELEKEKNKILKIIPPEFSQGVDRDLLTDIKSSSKAFKNEYGVGFVDKLIVLMGVRKIAK